MDTVVLELFKMKQSGIRVSEILGALIELVKLDIEKKASRELTLVRTELEMAQMLSICAYEHLTPSQVFDAVQESYKHAGSSPEKPKMRFFPIMHGVNITGIPWEMVAPFEAQALKNHSQNLEVLASRGGLTPYEMFCVRNDQSLNHPNKDNHAFYSQLLIASVIGWDPRSGEKKR